MNSVKLRRILILAHLYFAALLAPFFLLVGVTGALYVADVKGGNASTPLELPAGAALDPKSPTLDADVAALLEQMDVKVRYERLSARGATVKTWPISRAHVQFNVGGPELTAELLTPDLPKAMMELHKGHGPKLLRTYQIFAGATLALVVLGGILVGLLAASYRQQTIIAAAVGTTIFALLAFVI
ncbi:MAG: hypothetical protein AAFX08_08020 [Pseudomonadota bacterium]